MKANVKLFAWGDLNLQKENFKCQECLWSLLAPRDLSHS